MEERRTTDQNLIRKALQNEISWLLMIGGTVLSIFKFIVLPINEMQITLAQVHTDITRLQGQRDTSDRLINELTTRVTRVETKVEQIAK
jgi:hypothetical protein